MAQSQNDRRYDYHYFHQQSAGYNGQNGGHSPYTSNSYSQGGKYSYQQQYDPRSANQGFQSKDRHPGQNSGLTDDQRKERQRRRQELLKNRRLFYGFLVIILILVGYSAIRFLNGSSDAPTDAGLDPLDLEIDEIAEEEAYTGPPITTISFVGDVYTSVDQIAAVSRSDGTYDFSQVFMGIEDLLVNTDYAVANFETTMVDGESFGTEPYYNAPVQLAGTLRSLGIRLVSTANTYMLNNGIEGLQSTRAYLSQANLKSVGTYLSQQERDVNGGAYIREIHGIRFAFLSYTKGTDSVMMPDGCEYAMNTLYTDYSDYWTDLRKSQIRSDIQAVKDAGAEIIIALVHWGSEYGRSVSDPQKEVADLLLGNGVDVIVGTHSHLVNEMGYREVELSDGTTKTCFVAYGIGDFYSDPAQENAQTSLILNLTFARDESGTVSITEAGYIPLFQHITDTEHGRNFELVDVYRTLATLYRTEELNSNEAVLYNSLLDSVASLHSHAGEEYDLGPRDEDLRVVRQAIADGGYSTVEIREMQKAEKAAAKAAENDGK